MIFYSWILFDRNSSFFDILSRMSLEAKICILFILLHMRVYYHRNFPTVYFIDTKVIYIEHTRCIFLNYDSNTFNYLIKVYFYLFHHIFKSFCVVFLLKIKQCMSRFCRRRIRSVFRFFFFENKFVPFSFFQIRN